MSPVTAAHWNATVRTEAGVLFEFIEQQMKAESRERGHDCGHQFTITVTSRGHYGAPDGTHHDAADNGADLPLTLTVRAHNLRDALLRAASHGLADWSGWDDEGVPDA